MRNSVRSWVRSLRKSLSHAPPKRCQVHVEQSIHMNPPPDLWPGVSCKSARMSKQLNQYLDGKSEIRIHPSKQYKSAYKPCVSSVCVEYEAFQFRRHECIVDGNGNADIIQHKHVETILIAKDWQRFIREGTRKGGYIAKGLSKFAFKVSLSSLASMFSPMIY